jgi:hypothetical protein
LFQLLHEEAGSRVALCDGAFLAIHDVLRTHVDEWCFRRTTSSVIEHTCPELSISSNLSSSCHLHVIVLPSDLGHTLLRSATPASTEKSEKRFKKSLMKRIYYNAQ